MAFRGRISMIRQACNAMEAYHMDLGHQAEEAGMNALRAGAVGAATGAIGKKFKGMMAGPMAEEDAGNFLNSSSVDKKIKGNRSGKILNRTQNIEVNHEGSATHGL